MEEFRLSPEDHESVYTDRIEPIFFDRTSPVGAPRAVIVGGQPVAGKTRVMDLSKKEFENQNVVVVNTDDLRAYHPRFEEITFLDDKLSASRTHEAASAWNQKLLSRAIETKRNIVLEGVLKDSAKLTGTIQRLREAGYEVTVRIVAVHERYSLWGIHKRYEGEKKYRKHGRFVPLDYHSDCYLKLLDSADVVEVQAAANKIEVFNRDGDCLYANELEAGKWKNQPGAKLAIDKERRRPMTVKQIAAYEESWFSVIEDMEDRGATAAELKAVKALARQLIRNCLRAAQ